MSQLAPPPTRTRIKICGLTREEDVDAAVSAGADAIGFVLYPKSPRAVTPERAAELAKRLPPFITPVLLFVNASAMEIGAACAMIAGASAQFHGDESPQDCLAATDNGARPYLRAARIPLGDDAHAFDLVKYAHDYSNAQQLVTSSSKRQRSPRLEWWTHQCKRGRWHHVDPAAL